MGFSGFRIPNPCLSKSNIILYQLAQTFSVPAQKYNNFKFCEICDYYVDHKIFFPSLLLLLLDPGSEIRDV